MLNNDFSCARGAFNYRGLFRIALVVPLEYLPYNSELKSNGNKSQ
jgi:hypothetical protein